MRKQEEPSRSASGSAKEKTAPNPRPKPSRTSLDEMGFVKNWIVETIVSTYDGNHVPRAAPMGATMVGRNRLTLKPYTNTATYRNLREKECGVVNITSEPLSYFKTLFKNFYRRSEGFHRMFEQADSVDAPRLKEANAYAEVQVLDIMEQGERATVLCSVVNAKINEPPPVRAYSRASFAVIESLIHYTRVQVFQAKGEQARAEALIHLIQHYYDLVRRIAPDSPYSDMMEIIMNNIRKRSNQFEDNSSNPLPPALRNT